MGFNVLKFEQAPLELRQGEVLCPSLSSFFSEGEEPVFIVRGLTGAEVARANEAKTVAKNITEVIAAIASSGKKSDAIKELLGLGEDTPDDIVRRQMMAFCGILEPKLEYDIVAKLSTYYPVAFYAITNKIIELTGDGSVVGKQKRSTGTIASAPH